MPDRARRCLRCPHCGDRDHLRLIEAHEEVGGTDAGRINYDEHGSLIAPSEFHFEPGDPTRVEVICDTCGHDWRPRSQSVSSRMTPRQDGPDNESEQR